MIHSTTDLIRIGKLTGTHGVKGDMKFYPYSGSCDSLKQPCDVLLVSPSGIQHEKQIQRITSGGGKHTISFAGIDSINQVQKYISCEICVQRSQLPEPDENEYYWCDLMGLHVVTDTGQALGTIVDIFETGSNDIYVVKNNTREFLIPAIADVIVSVDLTSRLVTISPLDGLLDL